MKFTDEHIYDAPLATVEKMYFDTGFCPRKYAELGLENIEIVSSSDAPATFHVSCRFLMEPTLTLPGFIRKILPGGERIAVQQSDHWNTLTRKGYLDIQLLALDPVHIHCDMSLEEHPRGAVNRMNWTVECKVPLLGGKLADFLGKDIQQKSAHDLEASKAILQDYL